jgi:hypothetical protein
MTKSTIIKTGFTVCAGLLLLSSCGFSGSQSATPYRIVDHAGGYKNKIPAMVKEAERLTKKKFKGQSIVILKPKKGAPGKVSELVKRLVSGDETDPTIAYAYYVDSTKTAVIQPVVKRPAEWAMIHEIGHCVLMSNGIDGHPKRYASEFKYW